MVHCVRRTTSAPESHAEVCRRNDRIGPAKTVSLFASVVRFALFYLIRQVRVGVGEYQAAVSVKNDGIDETRTCAQPRMSEVFEYVEDILKRIK